MGNPIEGLSGLEIERRHLIIMTIIANVANPIGHVILRKGFHSGISLVGLFFAALPPALIFLTLFWFLR